MPVNHIQIFSRLLLLLVLASVQRPDGYLFAAENVEHSVDGQNPCLATGDRIDNANYLTQIEKEVIMEINLLRSNPPAYARQRIAPLRVYYHGKMLFHPEKNPVPIETSEGVAALDECIRILENTKPLPLILPTKGLTLSAHDMVQDQGATKNTGHIGCDGSTMSGRIERYGEWDTAISENISYGFHQPKYIIAALLIDDGVPSRGHRITLLNNLLNLVGVSIGPHRRFDFMCVMDFAAEYTPKPQ
jgi:uncharacterized protein YkwD